MTPTQKKRKEIKRKIYNLADQGFDTEQIARHLNDNRIKTVRGKTWTVSNVIWNLRDYKPIQNTQNNQTLKPKEEEWKDLVLEVITSNIPLSTQKEILRRVL